MISSVAAAATQATTSFNPVTSIGKGLGKAAHWLDEYTTPRESTQGDFESHDYKQSLFHSIESGYAFMGLMGISVTAASSLTSTFAVHKTGSRALGAIAGAATGAAAAAAVSTITGGNPIVSAVGGALLGALQSMRGDKASEVRDASGGATMLTGLFLPGTTKIAGALGAGAGAAFEKPAAKIAIGALTAGALGAVLGATGIAPGGALFAAGISALGGAVGPFFGPRFSQFFRNLANDCGKGVQKLAQKTGHGDKLSETMANEIGSLPASFTKEGIRGFINSDCKLIPIVVGGLIESIELMYIFTHQKTSGKTPQEEEADKEKAAHENPPAASPQPAPAEQPTAQEAPKA